MSPDDARAKWDDWAAHCKERALIFDMASPNPKKPLRLRVPTSDSVDFASSAMHSKEMEKQSAVVKRPKDIGLDMMHARTLVGFDKIGNGSAGVDNMNLAQSMVSAGAGTAFDHVGMNLPDITVLGKRDGDDNEDNDIAMDGMQEDGVFNSSPAGKIFLETVEEPPSNKKKKWFDIAGSINPSRRQLRCSAESLRSALGEAVNTLRTAMAELKELPTTKKRLFAGEMAVAEVGLNGCDLVMGTS